MAFQTAFSVSCTSSAYPIVGLPQVLLFIPCFMSFRQIWSCDSLIGFCSMDIKYIHIYDIINICVFNIYITYTCH